MSSKFKVYDDQIPVFVTSTVVGWVDALSREYYKEIICKSLIFCTEKKGLILHAWVIMSNHIHLFISAQPGYNIGNIMRDFKKYTSKKIVAAIKANAQESRRNWMLNLFEFTGANNSSNEQYQFWQQEYHPVTLDTAEKMFDRFNYLHNNPVTAGIVWLQQHYKYSSASDYFEEKPGLIPITKLML
jgi:putative transposase